MLTVYQEAPKHWGKRKLQNTNTSPPLIKPNQNHKTLKNEATRGGGKTYVPLSHFRWHLLKTGKLRWTKSILIGFIWWDILPALIQTTKSMCVPGQHVCCRSSEVSGVPWSSRRKATDCLLKSSTLISGQTSIKQLPGCLPFITAVLQAWDTLTKEKGSLIWIRLAENPYTFIFSLLKLGISLTKTVLLA